MLCSPRDPRFLFFGPLTVKSFPPLTQNVMICIPSAPATSKADDHIRAGPRPCQGSSGLYAQKESCALIVKVRDDEWPDQLFCGSSETAYRHRGRGSKGVQVFSEERAGSVTEPRNFMMTGKGLTLWQFSLNLGHRQG